MTTGVTLFTPGVTALHLQQTHANPQSSRMRTSMRDNQDALSSECRPAVQHIHCYHHKLAANSTLQVLSTITPCMFVSTRKHSTAHWQCSVPVMPCSMLLRRPTQQHAKMKGAELSVEDRRCSGWLTKNTAHTACCYLIATTIIQHAVSDQSAAKQTCAAHTEPYACLL